MVMTKELCSDLQDFLNVKETKQSKMYNKIEIPLHREIEKKKSSLSSNSLLWA